MRQDDTEYYSGRAVRELELASIARNPRAARIHIALATTYLEIVDRVPPSSGDEEEVCQICSNPTELVEAD